MFRESSEIKGERIANIVAGYRELTKKGEHSENLAKDMFSHSQY